MREEPFEVRVGEGSLVGCAAAEGAPALLLHGGPAIPDYMGSCALELEGLFATIRYTQRGVPPSTVGPPYSIRVAHRRRGRRARRAPGAGYGAWAVGATSVLAVDLDAGISVARHPERGCSSVACAAFGGSTSPNNRSLHLADRSTSCTAADRGGPRPRRARVRRFRRRPGGVAPRHDNGNGDRRRPRSPSKAARGP